MPGMKDVSPAEAGFSRRQLIGRGAGTVALGGAGAMLAPLSALAGDGEEAPPAINGTVAEVTGASLVLADYNLSLGWPYPDAAPSGDRATLRVSAETEVYRDGPGKAISDLRVGDAVIAYVSLSDDELVASAVEPVYIGISAQVLSRSGDSLETSSGPVILTAATLYRRADSSQAFTPLSNLPAQARATAVVRGNQIGASCRREPGSSTYVAAQIVVE